MPAPLPIICLPRQGERNTALTEVTPFTFHPPAVGRKKSDCRTRGGTELVAWRPDATTRSGARASPPRRPGNYSIPPKTSCHVCGPLRAWPVSAGHGNEVFHMHAHEPPGIDEPPPYLMDFATHPPQFRRRQNPGSQRARHAVARRHRHPFRHAAP